MRKRLGPVLPRMRRGIGTDVRELPSHGWAVGVVLLQGVAVVKALVTEQSTEPLEDYGVLG